MRVRTRNGRIGNVAVYDPCDDELTFKVHFDDHQQPESDWFASVDIFAVNGTDLFTGKPYEAARFPESNHGEPFAPAGPSSGKGNLEWARARGRGGHEARADSIPASPVGVEGEDRP